MPNWKKVIISGSNASLNQITASGDVLIASGKYLSWGTAGATSIEGSTASNKLQFRTNSSDRMIIDSSGNVGIGTTNPDTDLHILGTTSTIKLEDADGTDTFGRLRYSGTSQYFYSRNNTSNGNFIWVGDDGTSSTEFMRIKGSNGNVGIGTTNPNAKLHIVGTTDVLKLEGLAEQGSEQTTLVINASGEVGNKRKCCFKRYLWYLGF